MTINNNVLTDDKELLLSADVELLLLSYYY